jgi:hypothetical protein
MKKTALEVLITADMLLDSEENWLKGSLQKPKGLVFAYCILGAITAAAGGNTAERMKNANSINVALEDVNYALTDYGYGHLSISEFNDAARTVFEDVKSILHSAIEREKRK